MSPPQNTGLRAVLALFFAASGLDGRVRAQSADEAAIVQADKLVVAGDAPARVPLGTAQTFVDPKAPILQDGWANGALQVPNLGIAEAGSSSFGAIYSLRGLSNTPYFSDPSLTLYFDDIPLGSSFSYPTDVFGFATASVFLGPQPGQFGRSGEGGVIVLDPAARVSGSELRTGIGNFDARSAALEAGGALGSDGDAMVAFSMTERSGYIENTETGRRVDDLHALTAFARQRLRPTAASEVTIEILADRHHDGAAPLVPLSAPLYSVNRSQDGETDTAMYGAAIKGSVDSPFGLFSATTSYTHWKIDPYEDWLVLPPALLSDVIQSQYAWNEEIHLTSLGHSSATWDVGGWLATGHTAGSSDRSINGYIPIEDSDYGYAKHEAAVFGETEFALGRRIRISLGAREEVIRKFYHQEERVPTPGLGFRFRRSDAAFLPKVEMSLNAVPDTEATASVSEGSKPGGFSAYTDNPALIPFAAESTLAFEIGLRRTFQEKALSFSVRAFEYEIRNYQIERSFSATDYFVATAPRARSAGTEFQAEWAPSTSWTLAASAGVQDVTLLEFRDPLNGASYNGNKAPYAPSYTGNLTATHHWSSGWFAAATCSVTGKTFYTESENALYAQPEYFLLGARGGYESKSWRVTAYIGNATNKGYYTLIVPGVGSAAPGAPRTYGTEVALKF